MHPRTAVAFPRWMITETRCARYCGSCSRLLRSLCVGRALGRSCMLLGQINPSSPQRLGQRNVPEKGGNTSKSSCIPHLGPRNQSLLKPEMNVKVPWCLGIRHPKLESYHPSMAQLRLRLVSCHQTIEIIWLQMGWNLGRQ